MRRIKEIMVCGGILATILFPVMVMADINTAKAEPQTTKKVEVETEMQTEATADVEQVFQNVVSMPEPQTKVVEEYKQLTTLDVELEKFIKATAIEYQLEPALVFAIIEVESHFNVDCVGDSGRSIGLMQIQPTIWQATANGLGANIYTPEGNVITGCAILNMLTQVYDFDTVKVLKAYNSGNPNYPTTEYVDKVMAAMESYK